MSTTILKGLKVIEYLAHANGPRGISQVARDIDMNKSAVQRIISTLNKAGYVEQAQGGSKYQLTLSIWELGSHAIERHEARRLLHPILRFGAQKTGFTAFLTYASFPFVVYLDKVEGAHGRTYTAEPGSRIPMNRTAAGKAVMAFLSDEDIERLGQPQTDWTGLANFDGLAMDQYGDELAAIRRRRFAISEGGLKPGVNSVAAPIWWRGTSPYGSIVLTADAQKLSTAEFDRVGADVVQMAEEATIALGARHLQQQARN